MKPFSKILVPIDFSAHSENALRVAADLARHYEATLCVIHVYEPYQPLLYAGLESAVVYSAEQARAVAEAYGKLLDKASHDARAAGAMTVETKLVEGVTVTEILRFAKQAGCDLIVMGTHGRTGIAHALIGSVAERVVRTASCPVLAVRSTETK